MRWREAVEIMGVRGATPDRSGAAPRTAAGEIDLARREPFRIGALEVLPSSREVIAPCARLVAEPRPLQVLIALHDARGAVLSRDALVDLCWGGRAIGEDAVQRAVAKARQLASLTEPPAFAIATIARVGYRLTPAGDAAGDHAPDRPPGERMPASRRNLLLAGAGAAALAAMAVTATLLHGRAAPRPPAVAHSAGAPRLSPADPVVANLLVQARDDWAQRTSESLSRSIAELGRVTRLAPDFAPAFVDLADAYLLAGEAGPLPDNVAFDGAEHAASRALALDPALSGAHRAMGFILYWGHHDPARAGEAFREAIRLDPGAAQTRFWYANALVDNGEDAAAMREFNRARLVDPGSDQIGADYAWALWTMGRDGEAADRLHAIVARNPNIAEAQDCLAIVSLSKGDDAGFLKAREAWARLRAEPALTARAGELSAAYARGGGHALLTKALMLESEAQKDTAYPDHSEAAFYASLAGDRAALLQTLGRADAEHETWGSAGYVRRIQVRWGADPQVRAALARRARPPMEGARTASL